MKKLKEKNKFSLLTKSVHHILEISPIHGQAGIGACKRIKYPNVKLCIAYSEPESP